MMLGNNIRPRPLREPGPKIEFLFFPNYVTHLSYVNTCEDYSNSNELNISVAMAQVLELN